MAKKKSSKKITSSELKKIDRATLERIIMEQQQIIESQGELIKDQNKIIDEEKKENEDLKSRMKRLEGQNKDLVSEIEELTRAMHRSAAPFRIEEDKRVKEKKSPGRKKGHPGIYRPTPTRVDNHIEVPLEACPQCTGKISNVRRIEQLIEEIPPPKVEVTRLVTYRADCSQCGAVESDHPLKVSQATGAAKTHLGPRAQAMAIQLLYDFKLTKSKTARILEDFYELKVSRGGLVNLSHKMRDRCQLEYKTMEQKAKNATVLYADETSWYVGSPNHYLWFFGNPQLAIYRVVDNRKRENIEYMIGGNYKGVLVSDCLSIYDGVNEIQQKCYAHHLKEIKRIMRLCDVKSKGYLKELRMLLKAALILKSVRENIRSEQYDESIQYLEHREKNFWEKSETTPWKKRLQIVYENNKIICSPFLNMKRLMRRITWQRGC